MPNAAILAPLGPTLTPDETAFFRAADPWGFILFARNVEDPDQLRRLTAALRDALGRDAPILTDQEGGRVQRLRAPHWREWRPPLEEVTNAGPIAERVMYLRAALIAAELREVGIDTDCAPDADVAGPATHPFLRNRCHGEDAATVTTIARAVADGLLAGGCLPVIKHMPGHGQATTDSHLACPRVDADPAILATRDFAPFKALADLPLGMTAHIVFPAFDPRPATQSPVMIDLIRQEIGFQGLLMSDDLYMEALKGSIADRAAAAVKAGCDLVLCCKGLHDDDEAVTQAVGPMTQAAMARADRALTQRPKAPSIDIAAAAAEFAALTGQDRAGQGTA